MRARLLVCAAGVGAVVLPLTALPAPVAAAPKGKAIALSLLGSHRAAAPFNSSAAEISAHDPLTQRLFVVNAQAGKVDVLDVSDPTTPVKRESLSAAGLTDVSGTPLDAASSINSVAVRDGVLAVAVQAGTKTDLGWAAFYRTTDLAPLGAVRVGAQPDMIVFADDDTVLVANEAEPNAKDEPLGDPGFTRDPEGSVSVVDLSGGVAQEAVRTARFTAFEGAVPPGVRVFGPDVLDPRDATVGRVSRNLEPEYIAVDQQAKTAYVTLQEANAVAVLDIRSASFTALWPLKLKDWNVGSNLLDASDSDGPLINRQNWPVKGLLMPDGIASYQVRGATYLVTANEGDAREFGVYKEPVLVGSQTLCDPPFAASEGYTDNAKLGRLVISRESPRSATGCLTELHALGGRSFSILDDSGKVVFDSAGQIEGAIARLIDQGPLPLRAFNANNSGAAALDNRSDDKGPEPEGVAIGKVGGRTYAFIALERIGGVMTFDITDPRAVAYVDYVNNRVYDKTGVNAKDLGAEGITFIAAEDSPTGVPLVAVANEVSGTTTLFRVDELG